MKVVLEPIWTVYDAVVMNPDVVPSRVVASPKLAGKITARDMKHTDRNALKALMSAWLPAANAVLGLVVDVLPDPRRAQRHRIEKLAERGEHEHGGRGRRRGSRRRWGTRRRGGAGGTEIVRRAVAACDTSDTAPLVIYVSKMISIDDTCDTVAFARVFSGCCARRAVATATTIRPLHPDHCTCSRPSTRLVAAPAAPGGGGGLAQAIDFGDGPTASGAKLGVFMFMGRSIVPLPAVPAGSIVVSGLTSHAQNSTLSSTLRAFTSRVAASGEPILSVAIEPIRPAQLPLLQRSLRLLCRDPGIEVRVGLRASSS